MGEAMAPRETLALAVERRLRERLETLGPAPAQSCSTS
jgi:hypothetical protein